MATVIRTDTARDDLRAILHGLRRHSRPTAERLAEAFATRARHLGTSPYLGRPRPEYGDRIRTTVVGDHIIVYHATDDVVTVIRVVHGAQDLDAVWRLTYWEPPESTGVASDQ